MFVQIRQDLLHDGIEWIATCDGNMVSANQVRQSRFISCTDDGIVSLESPAGELFFVDSIDVEYEHE
jgi:hypothetical protein